MQKGQIQVDEMNRLHHPLAVANVPPNNASTADDIQSRQKQKKTSNSRRRRRSSRKRSSAIPEITTEEEESITSEPSAESEPFFMTARNSNYNNSNRHKRRSSNATAELKQNHKASIFNEQGGSPAFQSLVDIISEMKRLPSISITPEIIANESLRVDGNQNPWRRVRRHSEPPQKMNHHDNKKNSVILKTLNEQQRFGEPVFSNSFSPLQEEDMADSENNIELLVSPLNNDKVCVPTAPFERSRSQSVPNTLVNPPQHEHSFKGRKILYPTHLNATEAAGAVRSRQLYSGFLKVDMQDSSEANVECEELDASIYIFGSKNRNRALHGDQVAVELVNVDDMMHEKLAKRQIRYTRRLSAMSLNGSSSIITNGGLSSVPKDACVLLDAGSEMGAKPKYCGRVVCVLERPNHMLFSGTLSLYRPHANTLDNGSRDKKKTHDPKIIWFIPVDKRLPLVAVPIKNAPTNFIKYHEEYKNRIFLGQIQRWPATSLHPFGLIEKEIGWVGELGVHSGVLIADHHIKDAEFSAQVLKAAASIPTNFSDEEKKHRRNLSQEHINVFTLGDASQDLGNAFSVTSAGSAEKGTYEVGIHIPDVSVHVRADSLLDCEARERCCAVTLVDKKIPILPESFIKSHCNLDVGKQRLAYSVMCRFTENGLLLHTWIGKTIIKSKQHVDFNALSTDAKIILKTCKKLQQDRLCKLDGMSLAQSFASFKLAESGYPEEIERINQTDNDVLIQELLILANVEVAQKIFTRFPDQALLYRQESPKMSTLSAIQDYYDNVIPTSSVQGLLDLIREQETSIEKQETLIHMIRQVLPRAKYYSAGSVDISKFRHAGFGASICTLFTEPTQNYASIYIQRQLNAALKGQGQGQGQDGENLDTIDEIARHCNSSQLLKSAAEQESKKLYTAAYIYRQCLNTEVKKMTAETFVTKIKPDSLQLYAPEYDLELSVVVNEQSLPGGQHLYDPIFNEMDVVWSMDDKNDKVKQTLKQLSRIYISISADMKIAKPVFQVELIKQ